jgi:DNA-binding transcriptional ArsR family regulator
MGEAKRWRDTDHLERAVETAGGQEAFDAGVGEMLDQRMTTSVGRAAENEALKNGRMTEGPAKSDGIRVSDPQVMRALAHPARIAIVDYLNNTGAVVTATECASLVGLSPSAVSYHLRELAKYGLVEQAPSRGDGRERVWRSTGAGLRIQGDPADPSAQEAQRALIDVFLTKDFADLRAWTARQGAEAPVWREASRLMRSHLLLTAEELVALNTQVEALVEPYRRRARQADPPDDARTVMFHYSTFPEEAVPEEARPGEQEK